MRAIRFRPGARTPSLAYLPVIRRRGTHRDPDTISPTIIDRMFPGDGPAFYATRYNYRVSDKGRVGPRIIQVCVPNKYRFAYNGTARQTIGGLEASTWLPLCGPVYLLALSVTPAYQPYDTLASIGLAGTGICHYDNVSLADFRMALDWFRHEGKTVAFGRDALYSLQNHVVHTRALGLNRRAVALTKNILQAYKEAGVPPESLSGEELADAMLVAYSGGNSNVTLPRFSPASSEPATDRPGPSSESAPKDAPDPEAQDSKKGAQDLLETFKFGYDGTMVKEVLASWDDGPVFACPVRQTM